MKNWKLPTLFKTPLGVVFALGLLIMLVELLIMPVIHASLIAKHLSGVYQNLIDSILLTLIISPALYSLVFKRLKGEEFLLCMPCMGLVIIRIACPLLLRKTAGHFYRRNIIRLASAHRQTC